MSEPIKRPRDIFGEASSLLLYEPSSKGKVDAQVRMTQSLLEWPDYPEVRQIVLRRADPAVTHEWLLIKSGTRAAQMSLRALVRSSRFDELFEQLFPGGAFSILWADKVVENWSPPGEQVTASGLKTFADLVKDVEADRYVLEAVLRW